jgi:hypothetical protein
LCLKTPTKQNVAVAENHLKYKSVLLHNQDLYIVKYMRDTKHLGKHANKLAEEAKEKVLFRNQRKAVEAGAHGTLDYTIKEGVNKNKIADQKILKSKK